LRYCTPIRLVLFLALAAIAATSAQANTLLALQDFEETPSGPVWTYTGTPADFQSGYSGAGAFPANSPVGVGGSRAWHVNTQSGGNPLTFSNLLLPGGFDSFVMSFQLAAMNLTGPTGGPDDLDYVLVSYSLDDGATFVNRVRIRGAVNNDSVWAYDATGVASVDYLPGTEALFQPVTTGLQTTLGYSLVQILFPGNINQLSIRITPRSSSSNDSWLVDNVSLVGVSDVSGVPEPSTWALVGLGSMLMAALKRRKGTSSGR
jgi:hypothetical protein